MIRKVQADAVEALAGLLFDGMTIMAGGIGLSGVPETLIAAIRESGVKDLTVVSNNGGAEGFGLGLLLAGAQVRKMISSYLGENRLFERLHLSGALELELSPQGTLAERIRAGGAGIPAFFTRTGVGTLVADGKGVREFDGQPYVMERGLTADLAIVRAWKGDAAGNLVYRKTARNFNPLMATAARVTVAEVEQIVEVGEFDSDQIHTPGVYVDRIVKGAVDEDRVEAGAVRPRVTAGQPGGSGRPTVQDHKGWTRDEMAARAAAELRDGFYVHLGVGIPTLVTDFIPAGMTVTLQSDNSLARLDGKSTVAAPPVACFNSADNFAMIRGGHIDLAILGAMQVAANGDLANWMAPGKVRGMGGAMDLVAGVKRVVVMMEHVEKSGAPKLVSACALPLTGPGVVDLVVTDLGVFQVDRGRRPLTLVELAPGVTVEEIKAKTGAVFEVALA